jgi:hypothetical protein
MLGFFYAGFMSTGERLHLQANWTWPEICIKRPAISNGAQPMVGTMKTVRLKVKGS